MPSDGRYVIGDEIASGGMATVHLGRMLGDAGFARTVAIKRLHPQLAKDPEVCAMLLDEGRLSARIHHLNVVTTLDVVASGGELFVVMEYVHGEPVSTLIRASLRRGERIPPRIVAAVLSGALRGLHAAHEARDERGEPLGLVHRDVSPQNILVGSDGVARVLDFCIAKGAGRLQVTQDGNIKGKFGYMPPEQLHGEVLDRRADVYAAGVVLWEALVGARLFGGRGQAPDFARLLSATVDPPSAKAARLSPAYDAVVLRALAREARDRFATSLAMAEALEACGPVAPPAEVGAWVVEVAGDLLAEKAARMAAVETRLVSGIRDWPGILASSDSRVARLETVTSPARGSTMLWTGVAALGAIAIVSTFAVIARVPGAAASAGSATVEPPAEAPAVSSPAVVTMGEAPAQPVPSAASSSSAAPPSPRARVTPPAPPPRRAAGDGCSPPFTIDAAGHKHYKRECLK
jgi:serine/threonine-protein kinase